MQRCSPSALTGRPQRLPALPSRGYAKSNIRKNYLDTTPNIVLLLPPVTAAANTAEPAHPSDPPQDRAATRATRLLGLLHKLIDFGKEMAAAAQQRPAGDALARLATHFGTKSTALILASIARGLRLAAILEERLGGQPARLNPARAAADALRPRKPRAPHPKSASESPPQDKRTRLPTSRKIVAWARQYPIETVLLHLCRDLGLTLSDPLWQEVDDILIECCDDLIQKVQNVGKRTIPTETKKERPDRDAKSLPPPNPLMQAAPLWKPAPHMVPIATTATGPP